MELFSDLQKISIRVGNLEGRHCFLSVSQGFLSVVLFSFGQMLAILVPTYEPAIRMEHASEIGFENKALL